MEQFDHEGGNKGRDQVFLFEDVLGLGFRVSGSGFRVFSSAGLLLEDSLGLGFRNFRV